MAKENKTSKHEKENKEWLESFRWILENESKERAETILELLREEAAKNAAVPSKDFTTPYYNTIPSGEEKVYPGNCIFQSRNCLVRSYRKRSKRKEQRA